MKTRSALYTLLMTGVLLTAASCAHDTTRDGSPRVGGEALGVSATPFALECGGVAPPTTQREGNPDARRAAQKGLDYLADRAVAWQNQHQCFGCHVQAVTLEAFAVGRKHQYEVGDKPYSAMLYGLTDGPGGTRQPLGLRYAHGDTLMEPSKAFGGAALGRHDKWVGQDAQQDLLKTAEQLLPYQQEDGSIQLNWTNLPVGAGTVQGVYQAIQTWSQAYARTADDRWLAAAQKSEGWLQRQIDNWFASRPTSTQELNYAILGLLAAGVGNNEKSLLLLRDWLLEAQRKDGGWGFLMGPNSEQEGSNAFVTGQTLYTLRMMGASDSDEAVKRGMYWLIERQHAEGGWSESGFGKAEAMWGVLGLVSLDVLSLEVKGLARGMHVEPVQTLDVVAWDNSGARVVKIEVAVDDVQAYGGCGDKLTWSWSTANLATGSHIVDVRAYNDRGESSVRRYEVYAGDIYLTQLGSRFHQGQTEITLRDIAPTAQAHEVTLGIYTTKEVDGRDVPDRLLRTIKQPGAQGAMTFRWDGKDNDGKDQPAGTRYTARLSMIDATGTARQTEDVTFVHDTQEAQQANYSQVAGQLQFGDDDMAGVANTSVELLDEQGNVVEETRSTETGNYRFRNVKTGKKYKVRVRKDGYDAKEQALPAPAAAGAETKADFAF